MNSQPNSTQTVNETAKRSSSKPALAKIRLDLPVEGGKFALPPLPYGYDALEPCIEAETMRFHHDAHHATYVKKLNEALKNKAGQEPLEEIFARISEMPAAVRGNGGGHWNHTFFWSCMAPAGQARQISTEARKQIEAAFGSVDEFKKKWSEAGMGRLGSGWVWLIRNADGALEIITTPNQDNPLMDVAEQTGEPILVCDVWEHAYYLRYKNKRDDFIAKWFEIVDWAAVEKRLQGSALH